MFPEVRRQLGRWHARALAIPDPVLRRHALDTHEHKRAHAEGAAAFAVLAPAQRRSDVVRVLVAFQAMYDYLDTVSEQPGPDPLTNGWQLHGALVAAVDPTEPYADYYALHPQRDDGGYLRGLVDACRNVCVSLPSYAVVAQRVRAAATRAMESQGYNHAVTAGLPVAKVMEWTDRLAERRDLHWWELVGATGSSLLILALVAAAADPQLDRSGCDAIAAIYFPWAGALLALIDSLVDEGADERGGTHSLSRRYRSNAEAAERVSLIARRSMELARGVPAGERHAAIVAAMVALFATKPEASLPDVRAATAGAVAALGPTGTLPIALLRARRCATGIALRARRRP